MSAAHPAAPTGDDQPPSGVDQQVEEARGARSKSREVRDSKERRRSRSRDRKDRRRSRSRGQRSRRSRSRSKDRRRRSRSRDKDSRRRSRSRGDRRRSRSRDRRRRSRSRGDAYGYQGRVGRSSGRDLDPTLNFHDPFAALRSANQAHDPAEIQRQMQEQQLRARQLVLQQQAASAVAAASKTQREVYVGNLTAGLVTADMLRQLFNSTMLAAFPDMAAGVDPVVNVSVHTEGRYAFVELRTAEMSTASLQLNGQVQLLGATLSIGRPSGYVDPGKAAAAATVAAEALAKFQAESQALRRQTGQLTDELMQSEDTCYVEIRGMITADVLADDAEYGDVLADIHEECSKQGTVLRVVVPRPPVPSQAAELMGTSGYGSVFVQFLDLEGAVKARQAIHGRMFAGNTVEAVFLQPQQFMDAIVPAALPAAAQLAAAPAPGATPLDPVLGAPAAVPSPPLPDAAALPEQLAGAPEVAVPEMPPVG